jgi:peptidoglycan/LPS O-acetylase OafA/YrhL
MTTRLAFIDWMKAAGMLLIVYGHVVGGLSNFVTPPIYQKQLGVAFFLFVAGFSLARDTRAPRHLVVTRLFEIVLIGTLFALVSTVASFAAGGRGQLSNYLPMLGGVNVVRNGFPANPTTWYIGTYIHVIVLWVLAVRHLAVTPAVILTSLGLEVAIRAVLWPWAGGYVAYMLLTNWMTPFLLGVAAGRRPDDARYPAWTTVVAAVAVSLPLLSGLVWTYDTDFPFRGLPAAGALAPLVTSLGVTMLYVGATWLAFRVATTLRRSAAVELLSAQTIVVFVAHMPVYYALSAVIGHWPRALRAVPLILACYPALALAGVWLYRWLRPAALKAMAVRRLAGSDAAASRG